MKRSQGPIFYIHIGLPKTATTTIQYFLTTHRDALLRRGVLYPRSIAMSDGHAELHRVLGLAVEPESVPWLAGLRKQLDGEDVIASLLKETRRTEADIVILSSEALAFMHRPAALRQALAPHPVRILIYLRRQDSFLASFYNQLIKSGLYAATFEEFLVQHAQNAIELRGHLRSLAICNYERLLDLWADAFGQDNIAVGVYEDYDFPDGLLRDMAAKTKINVLDLAPPDVDANRTLQSSILSLKRRVNELLCSNEERILSERIFTDYIADNEALPSPEEILACLARRQAILASYQESNARVAVKYFGGRPHLFNPPNEHDPPLPDWREKDWQDPRHDAAIQIIARLFKKFSR